MSIAKRGVYKRLFFVGIIRMWITNLTFGLVRGIIKSELNSAPRRCKMFKIKNFVVVILFVFVVFTVSSCKSDLVNGNGEGKTYDTVEIMYERVLPDLCPSGECMGIRDPDVITVYNYDHGGHTTHSWQKVAENKWVGVVDLPYSNSPNMVFAVDQRIVKEFAYTGRRFYVRIRGQDQWIELTRITSHFNSNGEQAEFVLKAGVIITNF